MENKIKIIGTIIGVLLFILLVSGVTYAAFTWASDPNSGYINATSECFDIDYTKGDNILDGTLVTGSDYTVGLNATVKAKLSSNCPTMEKGIATLYLDVKEETSNYFIDNELLRYQVLEDGIEVASGIISNKGRNDIYKNIEVTNKEKSFTTYIWLNSNDINDKNLETIISSTCSVGIKMSAEGR